MWYSHSAASSMPVQSHMFFLMKSPLSSQQLRP